MTDIFIVLGRMIVFAIVVTVLALVYNFLKKFALFRFLGRVFQYTIIAILDTAIIIIFAIGIGFVNNLLLLFLGNYSGTDIYELHSVGITKITLNFVFVFVCSFVIGTLLLSRIPLTKTRFQMGAISIMVISTTILFPILTAYNHPSISIAFPFALFLSILSPAIFFIFLYLTRYEDEGKIYGIRRDHTLTHRERRREIDYIRNRQQRNNEQAEKIKAAIFPWIYFRKQANE